MRTLLVCAGCSLLLSGCFGGSDPDTDFSPSNPRAVCDSYAAQAIQIDDLATATALAAQASECYANLQNQRR